MLAKSMQMGGAESFEHVQKPATAIQDHVSSPNGIYNVTILRGVYDQYTTNHRSLRYKCMIVDWYQPSK